MVYVKQSVLGGRQSRQRLDGEFTRLPGGRYPSMTRPVKDTVYFKVSVTSLERDGRWVARTPQTMLFGYGSTQEEAEALVGEANVLVVRELKKKGLVALERYMAARSIRHGFGAAPDDTALEAEYFEGAA
jgi:hypothetical protein